MSATATGVPAARAHQKGLLRRAGLWLSVALNLFFIAMLAAHEVRGPRPPPGPEVLVEEMARAMPQADGERFRDAMARERPWYEMSRTRQRDARRALAAALRAEPYDEAAVDAAFLEFQHVGAETLQRFGQSMLPILPQLSHAGREAIAERTEHPGPPRSPRSKHPEDRRDP